MTRLRNGPGAALVAALVLGVGTTPYARQAAQTRTVKVFIPDPAKFEACGTWKQTAHTGDPDSDIIWQISRLGFVHGIAYGLQADPLGAYSTMVHPSLKAEKDPWVSLGGLDDQYFKGLQTVLARPAVLLEAFDQMCTDFSNERVPVIQLTLLAILKIGGLPPARLDNALVPLRAGGDNAWNAMMAALKGKEKE
jgi:hypothetical protein